MLRRWLVAVGLIVGIASAAFGQAGQYPNNTVAGNVSGARGPIGPLGSAQVTTLCNLATASLSGCVPSFPNTITTFFRGDGTYNVPPTVTSGAPGYVPAFPNNTTTFFRGDGTYNGIAPAAITAIPNTDILANISGSTNPPAATAPSTWFDSAFGSTRGSMLERGASGWTAVTPGTSGLPWVSNGAGADPAYQVLTGGALQYTAPGTGGTAVTQQSFNQRTLWANDYGAVCDGTTNDATAFTNLITEATTLKVPARFIGTCAINSALTIPASTSIDFAGVDFNQSVLKVATGVNGIQINTTGPVFLHDFQLLYPAGETASQGISNILSAGENNGSRYWNLLINGPQVGVNFTRDRQYVFWNNWVANIPNNGFGMIIDNATNCDDGDMHVYHNQIDTLGTGNTAVTYKGAGGLHFDGNKINGGSWANGFLLQVPSGCATSDLFLIGNSIEGLAATGKGVVLTRASTTGTFTHAMISNNEIATALNCISAPTDATGVWLSNVTVTGNTCLTVNSASAVSYNFDTINGLYLAGNAAISQNASTKLTNIGATGFSATSCAVGPNIKSSGTFAASSIGTCTSITPN